MRKYFLTGLAILLPLILTIWIVIFVVNLFTQPFLGIMEGLLATQEWAQNLYQWPGAQRALRILSQLFVLVFLFLFTVGLGAITRWFFFKSILKLSDKVLHRVPFVNKVYKTTQDIFRTIFHPQTKSFKQVVMVPFPLDGVYSLGLVSGESPHICKAGAKSDLISVFVPTTPNPTSGYLLMFPREKVLFVDMKVEDAVKFIISCGVIHKATDIPVAENPVEA